MLTVAQLLPELEVGGVEQGTLEVAAALVAAGHRAVVVSGGGRLVPQLEALGAAHVTLPIGRKRLSSLALVGPLRKVFREHRVDLVHARSRLPAWLGFLALRGMPRDERPRWVTTVHGPYSANAYGKVMASGERVIAISKFIAEYLLRAWPTTDPARVRLVPRGVDVARWPHGFVPDSAWLARWQSEHPQLEGKWLLVLPGRLTRWKGQEHFLQVVAQLRAAGLPVHGLLAGGPHPRRRGFEEELRALARTLRLDNDVSFLGNRSDLREIMAISRCAFSLTLDPEAFGRTTIEALSLGLPVIGYDHGGTAEILREVFPAGLVPLRDIGAAAERCAAFLRAPPQVPATHPYTTARLQASTLAVYEDLCASPRA